MRRLRAASRSAASLAAASRAAAAAFSAASFAAASLRSRFFFRFLGGGARGFLLALETFAALTFAALAACLGGWLDGTGRAYGIGGGRRQRRRAGRLTKEREEHPCGEPGLHGQR